MIKWLIKKLYKPQVKNSPSLTFIKAVNGWNCNHCIYQNSKCYNLNKCENGIKLFLEVEK